MTFLPSVMIVKLGVPKNNRTRKNPSLLPATFPQRTWRSDPTKKYIMSKLPKPSHIDGNGCPDWWSPSVTSRHVVTNNGSHLIAVDNPSSGLNTQNWKQQDISWDWLKNNSEFWFLLSRGIAALIKISTGWHWHQALYVHLANSKRRRQFTLYVCLSDSCYIENAHFWQVQN
jgi:hypothetical protein